MEYSTEMIIQPAQQVTDAFTTAMDQQLKNGKTVMTIVDIETEFRRLLLRVGPQVGHE